MGNVLEEPDWMPICLNLQIIYVGGRLQTPQLPLRRRQPCPWGLPLGTFTIRGSRESGPTQSIQVIQISGFYLMTLTENKITDKSDFCNNMR